MSYVSPFSFFRKVPLEDESLRLAPVDWAVKMRIRPPEIETSICDAKYHVSLLLAAAPSSLNKPPPPPSPEIVPTNLDEENPSVPILSGLLVQDYEGVLHPVVDLIDVVYRNLP
ncbi:hypothetical protein F511_43307 [Dorcoceras hygrometricum]|uniref:Uncharacterized protein n=1 Tax=Dorcoceras hygrometricum TaxID=472368 RepID=A0A2Z7AY72_9LAMI|nr:hypothetical protein F511_43307 [Dorcoceras hygrometricum]